MKLTDATSMRKNALAARTESKRRVFKKRGKENGDTIYKQRHPSNGQIIFGGYRNTISKGTAENSVIAGGDRKSKTRICSTQDKRGEILGQSENMVYENGGIMKTVMYNKNIVGQHVPIKTWLDVSELEDGALKQALNLSKLPFLHKHVALMPDCHQGYGMPIGGVIATKGVVIPNAVGVDIGCGMCAQKTNLIDLHTDAIKAIMGKIREQVPVGFNRHKDAQCDSLMPINEYGPYSEDFQKLYPVVSREYNSALTQLGTLGGGNHFIEIQKGRDSHIWVMIHSGSRNLGKKVADYYNGIAKLANEDWCSQVPREYDLAFLPINRDAAKSYMREMQYCVDFALANRRLMMGRIMRIIHDFMADGARFMGTTFPVRQEGEMINIAHNYAAWESHFNKNVIVHRKGATLAREDTIGIIPGSQGTKSYIVRGLGNADSFTSCSHGAGRRMGRNDARKNLNLTEEIKKLDDQGIIHGIRTEAELDEAAGAYKDIEEVMNNQTDLVEITEELTPMAVIKG